MYSSELLKGTLKTIILRMLSENGKMYGYEITQRVKELSGERIILTEGALYPSLHAMEQEGILTTEVVHIGKRVRKYYSLTKKGKVAVQERVSEFADFIATMKVLLDLKPQGQ